MSDSAEETYGRQLLIALRREGAHPTLGLKTWELTMFKGFDQKSAVGFCRKRWHKRLPDRCRTASPEELASELFQASERYKSKRDKFKAAAAILGPFGFGIGG